MADNPDEKTKMKMNNLLVAILTFEIYWAYYSMSSGSIYVNETNGSAVQAANVTLWNKTSEEFSELTVNGYIAKKILIEYNQSGSGYYPASNKYANATLYTNYTINASKYGYNERQVLYNWWKACKEMDKDLKRQKRFEEATVVTLLKKKAVETSYNYYKIEPQKITDRIGVVIFSLVFYVIYTMWYGFAIMYMFEGWGLQLEEH